jgi:SRSO17 transposase
MMDVVVAEDVEAWDASLTALTDGLGWLFARPEPRVTFGQLVRAMLADVPKKNCWGMAEYTGLANPKRFQLLLREGSWDEELLRDWMRGYVLRGLADAAGVLVVDDTQVIKKGVKSVGVAPQHCGATGQTENCQVMVMLSYASTRGHAFIDRQLYLPTSWVAGAARCDEAGVPAERRTLVTKPTLAVRMLTRALADESLAYRWLVADAGYGRDPALRAFCHERGVSYVLAVPVDLPLVGVRGEPMRPDDLLANTTAGGWERRSAGHGGKGERYWDWAAHAVTVKGQPPAAGHTHTLLIRRALTPKITKAHPEGLFDVEYFLVHAALDTPTPDMITAAGLRWNIEDDNKCGKDQLGLGDYQVRKWRPWHRHVTVSMLAHAWLAVTRAELGKEPVTSPNHPASPPTTPPAPPD